MFYFPWCHVKRYAAVQASSVYTIQPCTMSFHAKPHTWSAYVFSCNLPPALLAEWPGSFTCYCGNTVWNRYQNKSQHRKLTLEKKFFPPLLQGLEPEPATFQSWVLRSNHWFIPASRSKMATEPLFFQYLTGDEVDWNTSMTHTKK